MDQLLQPASTHSEPFPSTVITHVQPHHHHIHSLYSQSKLFIKRASMRACDLSHGMLCHIVSNRKLVLHIFTSLFLIAYLATNLNYLAYKMKLYYKELPLVMAAPWLLIIMVCECVYFLGALIASIDYLVPPDTPAIVKAICNGVKAVDEVQIEDDHRPLLVKDIGDHPLHRDDDVNADVRASKRYPTVHVMIPCCKEPTEVPQDSILAALALNYPKDRFKVLVLDDGGDDDLKAFCDTIRVESGSDQLMYLRRNKIPGVPHNFKCGNMNFGLEHSDSEYVVMMDADMILHRSFLLRLVPHIIDSPNVSFVQIPQAFYNLPIGDPLNDSCGFGYDRVLVHRNTFGCATCVGTGAIFRRKHLDEIGGFQPQSITEDTTTAYALFNRGYRSVYVNEKLQIGLTPWTFEGYVKQRQRWGQGAVQQLAATWKAMLGTDSKLNLLLKSCYFWHTGYYYMSFFNIALVLSLWAALAFNLNLTIGSHEENKTLLSYLAIYLMCWRLFWYVMWIEVPQAIQSRNRDESTFWWMTPFFFKMLLDVTFSFKSTFMFVPTSNIDQGVAAGKVKQSRWTQKISELKHVRVHIAFIALAFTTVLLRVLITNTRYERHTCKDWFLVGSLSFFMVMVSAHMSVPVLHILWPTGFRPEQRKFLLKYNADGVPIFDPAKTGPKWHSSVIFFELLSCLHFAFWASLLWAVQTHAYDHMCRSS